MYTLILECATWHDATETERDRGSADGSTNIVGSQLLTFEIFISEAFVKVSECFNQLFAILLSLIDIVGWNGSHLDCHTRLIGWIIKCRLHGGEVDESLKVFFSSNRNEDRMCIGAQALTHGLNCSEIVRSGAVHLIDECNARHIVFGHLSPDRFGLRLDAGDGAKYADRPV